MRFFHHKPEATSAGSFTLTATATDNTTGQTGQNTAGFTVGSSGSLVINPLTSWNNSGLGLLTLTIVPAKVTDLLVLAIGAGGGGKVNALCSGVSGGGVTQWIRASGYVNTSAHTLVEVWYGVVTTTGSSTVTIANTSMASEWNRLWIEEFTAQGTAISWQLLGSTPAATTATVPSKQAASVTLPVLAGSGLYTGAAVCSWGALSGSTTGFTYSVVESQLLVAYNANAASGAVPTATSNAGSSELWDYVAALFAATGGPPPLPTITTTTLPSAFTAQAYSASLTAANGSPPYTWSLISGSLPAGLTLSSAGIISGTPSAVGTSSFTIQVTDSTAHTATAVLSITVSSKPPVIWTGSYPPDQNALWTASALDPQLTLAGESNLPYIGLNVWGAVTGETMTGYVYNAHNFYLTASMSNPDGSVTCFPNAGTEGLSIPWQNYSYFISGWDEQMDATTNQIASACYDNWFTNTLVNTVTGQAVNEVMLHFDYRNRGGGSYLVATAVPFGGKTINGIAIPLTYWTLIAYGSTCYWEICDVNGSQINMPVGSVDMLAMNQYLVTHGFLANGCAMTGFSLGWEICDTQGVNRNFIYNNLWWYAA